MTKISQQELQNFITNKIIIPFNEKRVNKLSELSLKKILKRKNPYLFKAKNIQTAEELVRYILDAFLSSQEETIFGNLMEDLAIFVCQKVFGGYKPEKGKFKSVDLIFERENTTYIVSIKSGPYWGNKDQKDRMKSNFKTAKTILQKEGVSNKIILVNGCVYGKDKNPYKIDPSDRSRSYYKLCGQDFWELITDDLDFYQKIVVPIDREAKKRDKNFRKSYYVKINELTKEFLEKYLTKEGQINWRKIIDFTSKRNNIKFR